MQQNRGELVPIGEAIGNLSPAKAIRKASPPNQHSFTQADQVNQLCQGQRSNPG